MSDLDEYVTGELAAAYLEVRIHTKEDLTHLDKLPPHIQRTYYHEFIHYVQYNTSGYGLYYFWHVYDRLRQLLASLPRNSDPVVIPLGNLVVQEKKELEELFKKLRGSGRLPDRIHEIVRKNYTIGDVEIEEDPLLDKHFNGHKVGHVKLILEHPVGGPILYRFGETAIMETLTRLAEFKHFGPDPRMERYPYFVAEDLARLEYPVVADNPELLFALGDVSLMHPLPGWAFYSLLKEMKASGQTFTVGEDVIRFGLKSFALGNWRIPYRQQEVMDGINSSLDDLYHLPEFEATKKWVKTVLQQGHELRDNDPYFFVKLFREKPFTGAMNAAWIHIGGPHCINDNFERKIRLPQVLEEQDKDYGQRVYPQRLRMIWQMYELLVNGKEECGLYSICNNSQPPIVNHLCKTAPWERIHDDFKCPYAAAMILWGLSPRQLVINGVDVDTSRAAAAQPEE